MASIVYNTDIAANTLVLPFNGYYSAPFPFGRNYTTVTAAIQFTFLENVGAGQTQISEVYSFGAGIHSGFYLSLVSSPDLTTKYLPYQASDVYTLTAGTVDLSGSVPFFSGVSGSATLKQTGYFGLVGNPSVFVDGGFGVFATNGTSRVVQSGFATSRSMAVGRFETQQAIQTYLTATFSAIGTTQQSFTLQLLQQNPVILNESTYSLQGLLSYKDGSSRKSIASYTQQTGLTTLTSGYWTSTFSAGGSPLPLPNAFAIHNPLQKNNLTISNLEMTYS